MIVKLETVKNYLAERAISEVIPIWIDLTDPEREEVAKFIKAMPQTDIDGIIEDLSIINEHIANDLTEMLGNVSIESALTEEYELNETEQEEIYREILNEETKRCNLQSQILGYFLKNLKNNGIKDKKVLKNLLIMKMEELRDDS